MKDLRELKAWLEERGEVAHVTREVDPEYELVAVAKKINEKYKKNGNNTMMNRKSDKPQINDQCQEN